MHQCQSCCVLFQDSVVDHDHPNIGNMGSTVLSHLVSVIGLNHSSIIPSLVLGFNMTHVPLCCSSSYGIPDALLNPQT